MLSLSLDECSCKQKVQVLFIDTKTETKLGIQTCILEISSVFTSAQENWDRILRKENLLRSYPKMFCM